jgi:hypothetical protein
VDGDKKMNEERLIEVVGKIIIDRWAYYDIEDISKEVIKFITKEKKYTQKDLENARKFGYKQCEDYYKTLEGFTRAQQGDYHEGLNEGIKIGRNEIAQLPSNTSHYIHDNSNDRQML